MKRLKNNKNYIVGIISPTDFVKRYPFGGTSGFIQNIIPFFKQKIKIFGAGVGDTQLYKEYSLFRNSTFVPLFKISRNTMMPLRLKALIGYLKNKKKIIESGPDILYIHSPESVLPFIFLNKKNVPVVYHQHGSANPVSFSKHLFARNRFFQNVFNVILKTIYKRCDWIIVIDKLCLEQAERFGAKGKTSLMMNAVDRKQFRVDNATRDRMRAKYNCSENTLVVFFAGRLEHVKNVDLLIKSISIANDKIKMKLFLAGDGTQRAVLEDLANSLNIDCNFLGQVPHNRLAAYYNMSDVLVLPSKIEGVPMVILEALSCGTPVIATKVGGIPEIVNKTNGILIENPDPNTIASALVQINKANFTRTQISESVSQFSTEQFAESIEALFAQLIAKKELLTQHETK